MFSSHFTYNTAHKNSMQYPIAVVAILYVAHSI